MFASATNLAYKCGIVKFIARTCMNSNDQMYLLKLKKQYL